MSPRLPNEGRTPEDLGTKLCLRPSEEGFWFGFKNAYRNKARSRNVRCAFHEQLSEAWSIQKIDSGLGAHLALLKPTFCRVPIDSISGFVRTCKKVRYYGSLRHHVCTPGLQQPERNQSYQPRRGADSQPVGFAARCALVYLKDEKNPKRL